MRINETILELSRLGVLKDINEIIGYYWKGNVSINVLISSEAVRGISPQPELWAQFELELHRVT